MPICVRVRKPRDVRGLMGANAAGPRAVRMGLYWRPAVRACAREGSGGVLMGRLSIVVGRFVARWHSDCNARGNAVPPLTCMRVESSRESRHWVHLGDLWCGPASRRNEGQSSMLLQLEGSRMILGLARQHGRAYCLGLLDRPWALWPLRAPLPTPRVRCRSPAVHARMRPSCPPPEASLASPRSRCQRPGSLRRGTGHGRRTARPAQGDGTRPGVRPRTSHGGQLAECTLLRSGSRRDRAAGLSDLPGD
ncbi:hypothetical protein BV20DRAFT_820011 [Pilatotrama ljubarskyi]|nr:hypothetical protein BV20DRAFT_820011 [Pilatotrama ljubarskyi]